MELHTVHQLDTRTMMKKINGPHKVRKKNCFEKGKKNTATYRYSSGKRNFSAAHEARPQLVS